MGQQFIGKRITDYAACRDYPILIVTLCSICSANNCIIHQHVAWTGVKGKRQSILVKRRQDRYVRNSADVNNRPSLDDVTKQQPIHVAYQWRPEATRCNIPTAKAGDCCNTSAFSNNRWFTKRQDIAVLRPGRFLRSVVPKRLPVRADQIDLIGRKTGHLDHIKHCRSISFPQSYV